MGARQALVSPQRCDGPFEGAETDSPFSGHVGLGLGAGTLSPGRDGGEGLPSAAWGFVQGGGDNGGCGGAGIAGCQGSGTSCPSGLQRNLIRGAGPGRGGGAPWPWGCSVCSR